METLLSVAFDNLSSYDGPKIKKGLRQVEGLLAQICLSAHAAKAKSTTPPPKPPTTSPAGPNSSNSNNDDDADGRAPHFQLADLRDDAAFREFFKLQDGFQWNIATRLIQTLDRLIAKNESGAVDLLMVSALDSLLGVLLLHPPSRSLFSREQSMNLLLDLLEPVNCPAIQSGTLLVLVAALLETPSNIRTFEALDGLLTISSLFKYRPTAQTVKFRVMEFLYFYLMPETPRQRGGGGPARAPLHHHDHRRSESGASIISSGGGEDDRTLSQEEKQDLLRRHLPNVDELVRDLQQYAPFGGAVA